MYCEYAIFYALCLLMIMAVGGTKSKTRHHDMQPFVVAIALCRFINHACSGASLDPVVVRRMGALLPAVALFAAKDIQVQTCCGKCGSLISKQLSIHSPSVDSCVCVWACRTSAYACMHAGMCLFVVASRGHSTTHQHSLELFYSNKCCTCAAPV